MKTDVILNGAKRSEESPRFEILHPSAKRLD